MTAPTILDYYKYSTLATAAYVRLGAPLATGQVFVNFSREQERLPEALGIQLFNPADPNTPRWNILHYYGGDRFDVSDKSGFAATLFQQGTEKVLAIRGTEPTGEFGVDLFGADLGSIGILGLSISQVVSMSNLIQRLKAPAGTTVAQLKLNASVIPPDGPSIMIEGLPRMYLSFSGYTATAVGGIEEGEKVKVVGHSLGGHLAVLAARLFPEVVDSQVYVYDSAGYDPSTTDLLQLANLLKPNSLPAVATAALVAFIKAYLVYDLGAAALGILPVANQRTEPALAQISALLRGNAALGIPEIVNLTTENIIPGDDISIVSSQVTGASRYGAAIEFPTEANSHAMEVGMDSLALLATLFTLNPQMTFGQMERLLQVSSRELNASEERLTESIYQILFPGAFLPGSTSTRLPLSDATGLSGSIGASKGELGARNAFHAAILKINAEIKGKNYQLVALADWNAEDIASTAGGSQATAFRYALRNLNPFVLIGPDYASSAYGDLSLYNATTQDSDSGSDHCKPRFSKDKRIFASCI